MNGIVNHLVDQSDNGQYVISKYQLLKMPAGSFEELERAIFRFAVDHPNYTISIEKLTEDFLEGSVRITWRKNDVDRTDEGMALEAKRS